MKDIAEERAEKAKAVKLPGWAMFLFGVLSASIVFLIVAVVLVILYVHSLEQTIDQKDAPTKQEVFHYMMR